MSPSLYLLSYVSILNYSVKVIQNFNTNKSLLKKNQFINIYW